MRQSWQEEDIERILINPFSSITISSALTIEHEPPVSTDEWIQTNTDLIKNMGAKDWLIHMVDVLEGKEREDQRVNPFQAINIDPRFAVEHDAIVPRDTWIEANASLIPQRGVEHWLRILLDTLEGDIPTASNLGLGSFPDAPFGYTPEGHQPQRRYSFPQGGKRQKKKKKHKK